MVEDVKVTKDWMEALAGVRRVICHRNSESQPCPDGAASALVVHDAIPDATIEFRHHGADLDSVTPQPGLMFVDICPRAHALQHAAAGAIVLDHHKSHEAEVKAFGSRGVYGGPTESGAFLAWSHVWKPRAMIHQIRSQEEMLKAEAFALLASVRDTWQRSHPWWPAACEAAEALAFYDWATWSKIKRPFSESPNENMQGHPGGSDVLQRLLEVGRPLRAQRMRRAEEAAKGAMRTTTNKGTRIGVVNTLDTSDCAEMIGGGVDFVAGFHCSRMPSGDVVRFSLRSREDYDVGALAKVFDGGGHRSAAGFMVPAGTVHPVDQLCSLVSAIEDRARAD